MKVAVIFNRVSTKEQEQGFSLEAQEKLNREYARKEGFKVLKSFSISESASKSTQRKVFDEMTNYVLKKNIANIICEKVDRFTRNIKEAATIHTWLEENEERYVHFVKENLAVNKNSKSHEKFILNVKVSVAQFYADNLSEEVKKGQQEKLEQGWYPGQAKLGYRTTEKEGHKIPIPDENVAPLIKKALALFATGNYSVQKLANTMYEEGLRSKKGFKVSPGRIYDLLIDPFYYGDFLWNDELHHGKHEPLITKEIFDKNQSLLNRKNAPKYTIHNHLFKGLTHCTECDHSITWELQKGTLYGYCNRYKPCSQVKSIKEKDVETRIVNCLYNLQIRNTRIVEWIRKAVKEGSRDEIEYHESVISDLNKKLSQAQKRLDNLLDMRVDEQIDEETYKKKFKAYSEDKDKILDAIQKHSHLQTKNIQYSVSFYELSQRAKEIYLKAKKLENKRRLLRLMFSSLKIRPNTLEVIPTYTKPFQILSELVEFTNCSKVVAEEVKTDRIFEPLKKTDTTLQTPAFLSAYPVLR
ncbi:MAG: Resolvase [Microgenomates group bacterium GW2011_GWC1_37_8]|uniref:Resolvase n=1 Tax=Candidatus Woesebacteria bacterium GW2011_GWB1_38_8 TaxID=1618570 RepID=A0A0G0L117_9BACT|nr:MAG: Resolvase [Microgenomates group bacterium GW2011_GWC1_37_8]KKQ85623.1 MAG: Resolvase [Candidatus Woesebacteria bacterium GW2011_GWB1_38_8]